MPNPVTNIKTNPTRFVEPKREETFLDERELVGSNVEGIDIRGEAGIGLLGAVGAKMTNRLENVQKHERRCSKKKITYRMRVLILRVSMS